MNLENRIPEYVTISRLEVETDSQAKMLAKMYERKPPEGYADLTYDEAFKIGLKHIKKLAKKRYFVTTFYPFKLRDISEGAAVKTPAKYFDNYTEARIFQLVQAEFTDLFSKADVGELREFRKEFPEYFV